jgi:hypothetical protein
MLGLVLLVVYGRYLAWRRRDPHAPLTPFQRRFVEPIHAPVPTDAKARVLYNMFLAYLVGFLVVRLLAMAVMPWVVGRTGLTPGSAAAGLVSTLLSCVPLLGPLGVWMVKGKPLGLRAADFGLGTQSLGRDAAWGVLGYAMALPLVWAANLVAMRLFQGHESPLNPAISQFADSRDALYQALLFFQAAAMAPLVEEVMFRGVFFTSLAPRVGATSAMVLTSAVFAVLHPQLPLGFLGIFTLGLAFNMLYRLRGSLVPSIVAHALNNGAIFVLLSLLVRD